jgi:hypothetical protein
MTGRIEAIKPTAEITSKDGLRSFKKRELVLDCTRFDPYTGERGIESFPQFEFSGDKCAELDMYKVGQVVTVSFDLQGSRYERDGKTEYFTRVRGYKIEATQQRRQPTIREEAAEPPKPEPERQVPPGYYAQPGPALSFEQAKDELPF